MSVLGEVAGDIPVHPALRATMAHMRLHALELAGLAREADQELDQACRSDGERATIEALQSESWAPEARQRRAKYLQQMAEQERQLREQERYVQLHTQRGLVRIGAGNLGILFGNAAAIAVAAFFVVTIPRCVFDADPFLGVHGYALCPFVCWDCHGPFRLAAFGAHPHYYCLSKDNGLHPWGDTSH